MSLAGDEQLELVGVLVVDDRRLARGLGVRPARRAQIALEDDLRLLGRRRAGGAGGGRRLRLGLLVAAEDVEDDDEDDRDDEAERAEDDHRAELRAALDLLLASDALVERLEGLVDLGGLGRDLGQVVAGHGSQRAGDGARPAAAVGGVLEVLAGGGAPRRGLLAEEVVGDLVAAVVADVRAGRADRGDRVVRARLDRARARLQQGGDLVVGLALLEQELQRGALEVGEAVEAGHDGATLATVARAGRPRT